MTTRRLAAILAADVVGFSSMMETDEEGTLAKITALQQEIIAPDVEKHHGRIVKTMGDGFLIEFASPIEAVRCAISVQEETESGPLHLRIGINLGDIIIQPDGDVYGDGVNIAARLEGLADAGGICISGAVYDQVEGKIQAVFESRGEQQVKNIARPVRVYACCRGKGVGKPPVTKSPPLPDKPSIAVLPFTNMSGDQEQDYIADGLVEEVIAALSRVRSFFVISRNSTFTYKGKAVDPRQVGRDLGVRYLVEGSVRRSGQRFRIMTRLVDATTGNHIWSDRYDGEAADIFALQDRVTEAVVGAIEPSITLSEIEQAKRKRPDNLSAYDCVMRALPAIWSQDSETTEGGLRLAEAAIKLDPTYALPRGLAAWCYAQRVSYLRTLDPAEDRIRASAHARDAVRLDSSDPLVLTCAGAAHSITREYALARSLIEKALKLDPNSAWACQRAGWINVYLREPDAALAYFSRAIRLSPLDPLMFNIFVGIGTAHFDKEEYSEAAQWIEKGLREKPDAVWINRLLTASYFHSGQIENSKRAMAVLVEAIPDLTVSYLIERAPGSDFVRGKFIEAFRALGLPE